MKINGVSNSYAQVNIVSFRSKSFKLNQIEGINCAYCGHETVPIQKLQQMFENTDSSSRLFLDKAKDNRDYLYPLQKDVLDFLLNTRKCYDIKSDLHLLNKARVIACSKLDYDLSSKFGRLKEIVQNSFRHDLKNVFQNREVQMRAILSREKNHADLCAFVRSRRGLGIRKGDNTATGIAINELVSEIEKDTQHKKLSYIYYKTLRKTPKEFYTELFSPAESTMEHIQPKSKNGENEIGNYLVVCRQCNSDRKNISLKEYAKTRPQMRHNIDAQLDTLKDRIPKLVSDNKLSPLYLGYVDTVKGTILGQLGYPPIVLHVGMNGHPHHL